MQDFNDIDWHSSPVEYVFKHLHTNGNGLSGKEVNRRKKMYGLNKLKPPKRRNLFIRFLIQFHNVLIYILLIAALITLFLQHWVDAGVILAVVILNALVGCIQEGKAEKALQTIQATVATYSAATQALASPPGPPVTIPLAASVIAQGLANVARINNLSFANGGVVGGFQGSTSGQDTTTANVRRGEMFLNASQQRRLFDVANGNIPSVSSSDKVIEVTSIVQVDEREIARAVRNQRLEGFEI